MTLHAPEAPTAIKAPPNGNRLEFVVGEDPHQAEETRTLYNIDPTATERFYASVFGENIPISEMDPTMVGLLDGAAKKGYKPGDQFYAQIQRSAVSEVWELFAQKNNISSKDFRRKESIAAKVRSFLQSQGQNKQPFVVEFTPA